MKQTSAPIVKAAALVGMLCLIFDSKCAVQSASDAIELCLTTVIPSLFPMFVLSGILTSGIRNKASMLSFLETTLQLPTGSGSIYFIGLLGGFPVGAQSIAQSVAEKRLSKQDGERMLGYCNNCSLAFLFGIAAHLFDSLHYPLLISLIQVESSLIVALLWAQKPNAALCIQPIAAQPPNHISRAVKSMCAVCSWIILAGVFNGIVKRWLFPFLPVMATTIIQGITELTSGTLNLHGIESTVLKFILCSTFVNFGGICVLLQIKSIVSAEGLSILTCMSQKSIQAVCGTLLSLSAATFGLWTLPIPVIMLFIAKNCLEKSRETVYNSNHKGGFHHAVP